MKSEDPNPGGGQACARLADPLRLPGDVETALGGELFAPLGHQADVLGTRPFSERQHFLRHRHLEVHPGVEGGPEDLDVALLDVAPVFTKVDGDEVRPGRLRHERGLDRIRDNAYPAPGAGSRHGPR